MREQKGLLDSFLPKHEFEWDARLFVDSSIKQNVEFTLEVLARALSGVNEVKFEFHQDPKSHIIYQETDEGAFPKKTINYTVEARVDSYCFFGKNKIQVLCQIIDFWAGKQSVFPCGGAHFPNSKVSEKFNDLHERRFNENDIAQLQSKVHKITGDGDVMALFNELLGINGN